MILPAQIGHIRAMKAIISLRLSLFTIMKRSKKEKSYPGRSNFGKKKIKNNLGSKKKEEKKKKSGFAEENKKK